MTSTTPITGNSNEMICPCDQRSETKMSEVTAPRTHGRIPKLATFLLLTACCSEFPPSATPAVIRHRQKIEEWRSAQALSDAYVPEVQAGNRVALGKIRHVPFALYINSMHDRIHYVFEEELAAAGEAYPELRGAADMAVLLEIAVNQGDGRLARLGVARSSDSVVFDVVALEAVRRAAPFDAPPQLLVSPGGKVYIHWMFHSDPYQACATFNARPFLLASAPSAVAAGRQPVPVHLADRPRSAPPPLSPAPATRRMHSE
ncbi:energy transducer TonB family protein [Sorangium sp. So ce887]|uniref:energy transducer TonB family protein n=1 Tax=Sorangium sp. So ce887 TaxID=3133324 RepID=UPI003F63C8B3